MEEQKITTQELFRMMGKISAERRKKRMGVLEYRKMMKRMVEIREEKRKAKKANETK